jgi:hypothetical protein
VAELTKLDASAFVPCVRDELGEVEEESAAWARYVSERIEEGGCWAVLRRCCSLSWAGRVRVVPAGQQGRERRLGPRAFSFS